MLKPQESSLHQPFTCPKSLMRVFRDTWRWLFSGALLSFFLASVLMTGWPQGLIPALSVPYIYSSDGLAVSWTIERAIEGSVFHNTRSGYPFGSNFLDYPGADSGSILLLKLLGLIGGSYFSALNLFFLMSFPVVFIASFGVLHAIGLARVFAFCAAMLFVFLPFHFLRLEHLFYTLYFVVPLFFYVGFWIFFNQESVHLRCYKPRVFVFLLFGFVIMASFGVYYALFGVIVIGVTAVAALVRHGSIRAILPALIAIMFLIVGVLLNISPNLVYKKLHGPNPEVSNRTSVEAEIYGFKMMQLILPRPDHRQPCLADLTNTYNSSSPLVNENRYSSLGAFGAMGFLVLFVVLFAKLAGDKIDERLVLLGIVVFVLFLFGTIGGLGSLFSTMISPLIRGWNRISVFIAFGAITAVFMCFQILIYRYFPSKPDVVLVIFSLAIGIVGLYDQTVPTCKFCNEKEKQAFMLDQDFVKQIENSVPAGSAIYQLPYMPFPEVAPLHRLHTYGLVAGFLHSKSLSWSYAGMKGRDGDLFYRALARESLEKQLDVIRRLGFSGIYVDRRGFEDNAQALIKDLSTELGGPPILTRRDGEVVFFRLEPIRQVKLEELNPREIMREAGYFVDRLGARYLASLSDGIDFTRPGWPEFIRDVTGLSWSESWGRWSDADVGSTVRFDLTSPLPQKFMLVLIAQPFGPNADQELLIKFGSQAHRLRIPVGPIELSLPIALGGEQVNSVEFTPPIPTSPKQLGISQDNRRLGIGFIKLQIVQTEN
jgi:phosphoglycerol transferase